MRYDRESCRSFLHSFVKCTGLAQLFLPLLLIEHVHPAGADVDNLGTPIAVLLEHHAAVAVVRVADARVATDHALLSSLSKRTLFTDPRLCRGPHERIARGTAAVTLVAQLADTCAGLLETHDEVELVA